MLRAAQLIMLCLGLATVQSTLAHPNNTAYGSNGAESAFLESTQDAASLCISSFNETRERVMSGTSQSVIVLSGDGNLLPYLTLQSSNGNGNHYVLWQSLNGDIRGYALRNGKGFDYAGSSIIPTPLSWHPTLIWDNLFGSKKELKNYSCVLTGRTRVMGRKVSLIRLIPQEGLRYSFILAKEDESDFPIELTVVDNKGNVASRLTTMDSRSIGGIDFPIKDIVFDDVEASDFRYINRKNNTKSLNKNIEDASSFDASAMLADKVAISPDSLSSQGVDAMSNDPSQPSLGSVESTSAGASLSNDGSDSSIIKSVAEQGQELAQSVEEQEQQLAWKELNIPNVFNLVAHGKYLEGGPECYYQEYSDGITSFRVYRNKRSSIFYPVLTNGALSIVRKNSLNYEFSVVGEIPVALAEYVLTKVID